MTVVPLPDVPCVRVRLVYTEGGGLEAGNRFYLSYTGTAPTAANCSALAASIDGLWATDLAPLTSSNLALSEVDVLDIATNRGLSGQSLIAHAGSRAGTSLPFQCATNVEFNIANRYRGGKPRLYFLPGTESDIATNATWGGTFIAAVNAGFTAFFAGIAALSIGAMGTLGHVNLSYYSGFTNIANSSGRERAVPTYRPTAIHDPVTGYSCKAVISSQRRRRTSTTP